MAIDAYLYRHIDILHCTEPTNFITITRSPTSSTLISTADKIGYAAYITPLNHTYIRQTTLLTRLITQRSGRNGHLQVFLFKREDGDHTAVLGLYVYQRSHKNHVTTPHSTHVTHDRTHTQHDPKHFKNTVLTLINELKTIYPQIKIIVIGDFQHTVLTNTLHRMGQPQLPHTSKYPHTMPTTSTTSGFSCPDSTSKQHISHMVQPLRQIPNRTGSHYCCIGTHPFGMIYWH